MKAKKCKKCGKEYVESKEDEAGKKFVEALSNMFPPLHDALVSARGCCLKCYRETVNPVTENIYKTMKEEKK